MNRKLNVFILIISLTALFAACSSKKERVPDEEEVDRQQAGLYLQALDLDTATFAGGCFWCTEAYFERLKGVKKVVSGYAGGTSPNPTYKEVSMGKTNYAESVQVYYDPEVISYQDLLKVFFATMDPTQLNRQGPDVGEQYRSVVFYHSDRQHKRAREYVKQLDESGQYDKPIVTKIEPYTRFYEAEAYHQNYYRNNPNDPYVRSVTRPKVKKFEKEFQSMLKREYKQ